MKIPPVPLLAAVLATFGLALFAYKAARLEFPVTPEAQPDIWQVEAKVTFTATGGPASVRVLLPRDTAAYRVLDQSFVSRGFQLDIDATPEGRSARLSTRRATGRQTVFVRFLVHGTGDKAKPAKAAEAPPALPPWGGAALETAQALIARARLQAGDAPDALATALLRILSASPPDPAAADFLAGKPTADRIARTAADLLTLAGVRARAVHGIDLTDARNPRHFRHWIAMAVGGRWQPRTIDPANPAVPETWFPWWTGAGGLTHLTGGSGAQIRLTIDRATDLALVNTLATGRPVSESLLFAPLPALPLDLQQVYRVLMMVPLGVLLLVVLRNVVGVKSFGTFMPVLIALSFRETQLLLGIALFVTIIGIGLTVRLWMDNLRLLVVPRLATVLIVVIIVMASLSLLGSQLGIQAGLSVALFPTVIMTMTVERMSVVWDERGPREALQQGVGSLIVATLCYLAIGNRFSEHLFFTFPELLLVILAAVLLLGRYSGYRLTELIRFRPLAGGPP